MILCAIDNALDKDILVRRLQHYFGTYKQEPGGEPRVEVVHAVTVAADDGPTFRTAAELEAHVSDIQRQMKAAAANLEFEKAAALRDRITEQVRDSYCEFSVEVIASTAEPNPAGTNWQVIGIGGDSGAGGSFGRALGSKIRGADLGRCSALGEEARTKLKEALQEGLYALKGHRAVGGIRASIYNAMPVSGVEKLRDFMLDFEKQYAK